MLEAEINSTRVKRENAEQHCKLHAAFHTSTLSGRSAINRAGRS
jgi:hypothetical protein